MSNIHSLAGASDTPGVGGASTMAAKLAGGIWYTASVVKGSWAWRTPATSARPNTVIMEDFVRLNIGVSPRGLKRKLLAIDSGGKSHELTDLLDL
jgi:hypothetical protein